MGLLAVVGVAALALPMSNALAAQLPVSLGAADSFAVLAATTVTNTGASEINGDLGVSPGTALTGFPPGTVNGTIHSAGAAAGRAQADLTTAYDDVAGRTPPQAVSGDLGGRILTGGVYKSGSSLGLTGVLTLNGQGDPNTVFIFQAGSTLTTASASRVVLTNGAQACNVFWQIGSSATLGTTTTFVGNIVALTSITMTTGVSMNGRALARNGAVTLDNVRITATPCAARGGGAGAVSSADLTALSLSSGSLSPVFSPSVTSYTASVPYSVTDVTVTQATSPGASVVVTGGSNLAVGTNTVTVRVTSADGTATKTYSIVVTRSASSSAPAPSGASTPTFGAPISGTTTSGEATILTASANGASATVLVPADALPSGTTVSIYPVTNADALKGKIPPGQSYVSSFAVSWKAPDGSSPDALAPVTMTITDPGIHVGDTIYALTPSGLKSVGIARKKGVATVTFTKGSTFVVAATPKLVRAWIVGKGVRSNIKMRLGCKVDAPCKGTAKLSVRRGSNHGKTTIVATARFSLAAGKATNVRFSITPSGRKILFASGIPTRWVSMVLKTTVTGATRSVPQRVFVLVPGSPSRLAR